jgi:hypothetical protein
VVNVGVFYDHLEYLMAIWYNLWPFGIVCVHLVHFFQFWYHVPRKLWQPWLRDTKIISPLSHNIYYLYLILSDCLVLHTLNTFNNPYINYIHRPTYRGHIWAPHKPVFYFAPRGRM